MSIVLQSSSQTAARPPRAVNARYRVLSRPAPLRVLDSVQIFELAEILDSADSALVVWTLRGWVAYNQTHNLRRNYREGSWWTYNSLAKWCETRFKWLSCKQLSTVMSRLEKQGVILRKQFGASRLDNRYWYTVNESVLAALTTAKQVAFEACSQTGETSAQMVNPSAQMGASVAQTVTSSAQMGAYTTYESSTQESSIHNLNTGTSTTPLVRKRGHARPMESTPVKAVVVESKISADPEPESGEYATSGEGAQTAPRTAKASSTLVKALHREESNHQSDISKVPLKVLSESEFILMTAMMQAYARLGLTEDYTTRLIAAYGEDDVRACHQFVQANWRQFPVGHPSRIYTPPGWMTDELTTRRLNLPPVPYVAPVLEMYDDDLPAAVGASSRAMGAADIAPGLKPEAVFESLDIDESAPFVVPALAAPDPHPEPVGGDVVVNKSTGDTLTAAGAWECADGQLALLFDRVNYNRWLRDAWLKSYEGVEGTGTYTVVVPTDEAADMLNHRYHRFVHRTLAGLHAQPIVLKFEVQS